MEGWSGDVQLTNEILELIKTPTRQRVLSSDPNTYKMWPSIAQSRDGTLIVVYRSTQGLDQEENEYSPTGSLVVKISTDGGNTWSTENWIAYDSGIDMRAAGIGVLNIDNQEIVMALISEWNYPDNGSRQDAYFMYSEDAGKNWNSSPVLIKDDTSPATNLIQLSNGNIIFMSEFSTTAGIQLQKSVDGGNTWSTVDVAPDDSRQLSECAVVEIKTDGAYNGKLLAIARSESMGNYYKFISTDYGATWDSGTLMSLPNYQHVRPQLRRVKENTLILTRTLTDGTVSLEKSVDEGMTWIPAYSNPALKGRYADSILVGPDNNYFAIVYPQLEASAENFYSIQLVFVPQSEVLKPLQVS